MNPPFATRLIAPSWETFSNCIPTNPRSSWYSCSQHASEIDSIKSVPANTASTKIESSSVVHLELVAIYRIEPLAKKWEECGSVGGP